MPAPKLLPAILALTLAACAPAATHKDDAMMAKEDPAMMAKDDPAMMMKDAGVITLPSPYGVAETLDRVAAAAQALNFGVAARIDHAKAAAGAGLTLRPTELLLIGNPAGGTPLMQCAQTVGIDLPMKFLAYEDEAKKVWLAYNDPAYLMNRHGAKGCDEAFTKAGAALKTIAENALK